MAKGIAPKPASRCKYLESLRTHYSMFGQRPLLRLLAVPSFLVFFVFSQQVAADMFSWLKKYDVHLSPVVQGQVTLDGKPLPGITVFRELDYDKAYNDAATTDEHGQFYFAEKNITSRWPD